MSEPLLNVMKIMLLAALYLFFIRVLWAVYNELRDPRTRVSKRPAQRAAPVVAGPQPSRGGKKRGGRRGSASTGVIVGQMTVVEPAMMAGVTYALANEITIGRGASCGIRVDDGYVSQVHARIFAANGNFYAEDLASSNGSVLNGRPLTQTTGLTVGDLLKIGTTVLEFS